MGAALSAEERKRVFDKYDGGDEAISSAELHVVIEKEFQLDIPSTKLSVRGPTSTTRPPRQPPPPLSLPRRS